MASRSVEEWQRLNRPSFRRRDTHGSTLQGAGATCGIHPEMNCSDYVSRQRYYDCAGLGCNVDALYAQVEGDFTDESQKERKAWVQNSMEQQHQIMANIRSQPWPMAKKTKMLGLARQFIDDCEPEMGFIPSQVELSYRTKKLLRSWNSFWKGLLWGQRIRRITGMFGSGVASYFKLLRWLCVLNLIVFVFIFSLICIPQLVYHDEGLDAPPNYTYPVALVVDGEGADFEYSILFIGYYSNGRVNGSSSQSNLGSNYKLPVAYIVVMFWTFLICIGFLLFSMSEKHAIFERAKVQDVFPYSWRALATWDFSITNRSSILSKHSVLKREFRELVDEHLSRGGKNKCVLYLLRLLISTLVISLYIGSGVAIYFTVDWITDCPSVELTTNVDNGYCYRVGNGILKDSDNLREFVNFVLDFRLPIITSLLNICLSWVVLVVVKFEFWSPRKENIVSLVRIYVLYLFNLAVLTYSLYTLSQDCGRDCCWETVIGQQIYRLVCFELFSEFVSVMFADVIRGLVVWSRRIKMLSDWIDYPRFNLPKNTVNLIYGQTLVWLGMFFCPLLPLVSLLKDVVLFYLRSWAVRVFNNSPRHLYRAEAVINYYFALLLLLLVASMFPVGWAVTRLHPSGVCGPFRDKTFMIDAIEDEIREWADSSRSSLSDFGEFVLGLQTSAVVLPCFIILCIITYYYYAKASSLKEVKKDLIIQLDVEKYKLHKRIAQDEQRRSHALEPQQRQQATPQHPAYPTAAVEHRSSLSPQEFNTPHEAMINDQMV